MRRKLTVGLGLYTHEGFETFIDEQLFELITARSGVIRAKTLDIQRSASNPDRQKQLKNSLPIVIANGVFDKRLNSEIIEYSRYIIIDLDYDLSKELSKRDADLARINDDPYSRLVYLSPRGGIKVLVEHDNSDPAYHAELYDTIAAHFGTLSADMRCRDLARANFICYDPNAQLNLLSKVFKFTPTKPGTVVKMSKPKRMPKDATAQKLLSKFSIKPTPTPLSVRSQISRVLSMVQKWSDKKFPIARGQRNSNLFAFACALHDQGVELKDAIFYLTAKYVAADFLGDEIEKVIINAYK